MTNESLPSEQVSVQSLTDVIHKLVMGQDRNAIAAFVAIEIEALIKELVAAAIAKHEEQSHD